jgi:hypothetical protein
MRVGASAGCAGQAFPLSRRVLGSLPARQDSGGDSRGRPVSAEHYEYEEEVDLRTGEVYELPCREDNMRTSHAEEGAGAQR